MGISADYVDSLFSITSNEQNSEYYSPVTSHLQPPVKNRNLYNRKFGRNKKVDISKALKRFHGGLAKYQNVRLENAGLVKNEYVKIQDTNKGINNYENNGNGTEHRQMNEDNSRDDVKYKLVQFHKNRKHKFLDNNKKHDSNPNAEYCYYGKGNPVRNKAGLKRFGPEGHSKRKSRKSKKKMVSK